MNKYTIGDAHQESAFITCKDGYDVAVLHRYLPIDFENHPDHQAKCLTDEEWQQLIDIVNAAPALLAALKHIIRGARKINRGMFKGQETVRLDGADIHHVRAAIAKAEGRAE